MAGTPSTLLAIVTAVAINGMCLKDYFGSMANFTNTLLRAVSEVSLFFSGELFFLSRRHFLLILPPSWTFFLVGLETGSSSVPLIGRGARTGLDNRPLRQILRRVLPRCRKKLHP